MATPTLNDWKDSLLLGVAIYIKLIDENWDEFAFNTIAYTTK
jgi:hypothetical protein